MKRLPLITLATLFPFSLLTASEFIFREDLDGLENISEGAIQRPGYTLSFHRVGKGDITIVEPSTAFRGSLPPSRAIRLLDKGNPEDGPRVRIEFSAIGEFRFGFRLATSTAQRNGVALVRLLNATEQTVASFQLLSTEHAEGQVGLNPLSATPALRQIVPENILLSNHEWVPVEIVYSAAESHWSLVAHEFKQNNIAVDPATSDLSIVAIEIYTGFGAARNTALYLNEFFLRSR